MKKVKWILPMAVAVLAAVSCGSSKTPKVLVLYYSQTSNTRAVAEIIQQKLGADIEEIVAVEPYAGSFQETIDRCMQERQAGTLPEIQPLRSDLSRYDIIFLGYPVWFGTYAPPVAALLDQVDLSGKKVVPFCTFGSGGLVSSVRDLAQKQPEADILPGYGVRAARMAAAPAEIDQWLKAGAFLEGDYFKPEPFPASHAVSEAEATLFDEAVGNYPMLHAQAREVASRAVPQGTEYLFTVTDLPREDQPDEPGKTFQVYVLALDGEAPVFTQVVR